LTHTDGTTPKTSFEELGVPTFMDRLCLRHTSHRPFAGFLDQIHRLWLGCTSREASFAYQVEDLRKSSI
jgi:hypothetical protein